MNKKILDFFRESNNIEGVWDDRSLQDALLSWNYLEDEQMLTPKIICQAHKILMAHQPLRPREIGSLRKIGVSVGGSACMHPREILSALSDWCLDAQNSLIIPGENGKHIQIDHVSFERIHPFVDGNGRIGRMLMNWQRVKAGLSILVIKEQEKQKYYRWFKEEHGA